MKNEEKELVLDKIDTESFDYTFRDYSSFKEIKDKEFHKLRKAYIKAADDLTNYLEE